MIADPEILPTGLVALDATRARWCVWAPRAGAVDLVLDPGGEARVRPMEPAGRGHFRTDAPRPDTGTRYAYRLDSGPLLPDPCSRWQPDGVLAPSAVYWADRFRWDEGGWTGIDRADLVFYELHVGTFTPEGTFDAVIPRIDALLELGVTAIELMPVGQFAGVRSWGYDGVHPFAPQHSYGGPEGLQRLVDACHRRGMAVVLDAVYNHFGPEGNVFPQFGDYFTEKYRTDWGPALNYDGGGSDPVRAMVLDNARRWVADFHIDGLRLDASDQIYDQGPRHILAEVAEVVHEAAAGLGRRAYVFAETDLNNAPRFLGPPERGGYGLDGQWNDDFHHAVHATLTGEADGYYVDFAPGPPALAKVLERVFANDGNFSRFRNRRHGTAAAGIPGDRFVAFVQNHDQVGNRPKSDRNAAILSPAAARLAAGLLLLAPRLPLLFMGEEYGETRPFPYFCDYHDADLVRAVREGRQAEFAYFGRDEEVPDPVDPSTRDSAVLNWSWRDPRRAGLRRLYGDLLRLRRESPALRDVSPPRTRLLDEDRILEVVRGRGPSSDGLTIVFNLSPVERPLPTSHHDEPPSFRSEVEAYGAESAQEKVQRPVLLSHEFAIFGVG